MGVVYAARDLVLDRDIGLKTLRQSPPSGSPLARRFREEARITGQLQHPGIPPVHDLGALADGRPFLAMKLIKGRTLADLLGERPGPSHDRARFVAVFEQICQAVGYAHAHQVIHRDLKPANVMVGAFGEVQVMDWGLAKVLTEGRSAGPGPEEAPGTEIRSVRDAGEVTQAGAVVGTPAFMPREQAIGAVDRVDARSDVFGLGAVLCTILTGEPPYVAPSGEAARQMAAVALLDGAFARLDACGAEPELVALCKRCLAAEKADRPRDGEEVAVAVAALRAAADERARLAEVERERAEVRAAEQRKRRRVQLALAAAVLVIAAGGACFTWWQDRQAIKLAAEQQLKERQARDGIAAALKLSIDLRRQYRFREAADAMEQAAQLAAGAPELTPDVERARADLEFVLELDRIRMKRSVFVMDAGGKARIDWAGAAAEYAAAFRDGGLDVPRGDPAEVAAAVAGSPIRAELVAALDDWAALPTEPAAGNPVLEVLRRADPGHWLDAFRDATVRRNRMALGLLARAADVESLDPATLSALAEVMRDRGLNPTALLLQAHFTHPREFLVAFQLALWHGSRQEDGPAVAHFRAARMMRPENTTILNNLGGALLRMGDPDGAVAACRKALLLDPTLVRAHCGLGSALRAKGDHPRAIAAFREAIRLDPEYPTAHHLLGSILHATGDLGGAARHFREAVRLESGRAIDYYNLGVALSDGGDSDGAIRAYTESLRLDLTNAKAHYNLGTLLYLKDRKGNVTAAARCYAEAARLDPGDPKNHVDLGNMLVRLGQTKEAIRCYREGLRLAPENAKYHYSLGAVLGNTGDLDDAVTEFREAVRLAPQNPDYRRYLAHALGLQAQRDGRIAPPPRPVPPKP
jgi:tetratricopeptide (TPR) repeat protein